MLLFILKLCYCVCNGMLLRVALLRSVSLCPHYLLLWLFSHIMLSPPQITFPFLVIILKIRYLEHRFPLRMCLTWRNKVYLCCKIINSKYILTFPCLMCRGNIRSIVLCGVIRYFQNCLFAIT